MANLKEVEKALNTYIRPLTFPLAIKMLKSEKEIPEKTRRPFQQMKKKSSHLPGNRYGKKIRLGGSDGKRRHAMFFGGRTLWFF